MSLKFRVGNRFLRVIEAKINQQLSTVPEFEVSVPYRSIAGQDFYLEDAAIVQDGQEIITGFVYEGPVPEGSGGAATATIYCYGELGRLMNLGAFSKGHYQEQPIIAIIADLLNTLTDTWALGSISTMIDPTETTTIDLRTKETRWAQVVETISSIAKCAVRYGGFNTLTQRHEVEVGAFGGLHPEQLVDSVNIEEGTLKKVKNSMERIKVIEAFGGKAGDVIISLEHAQGYDNALIGHHPIYPVTFQGVPLNPARNWYICTNNNIEKGVTRRKDFDMHRTENSQAPTLQEILEAGFALWKRVIREFERNVPAEAYTCSAILEDEPRVGDKVRLIAHNIEKLYDPITEQETTIPAFDVDGEFFVTQCATRWVDDLRVFDLHITDTPYDPIEDDDLQVYNKAEKFDKFDIFGVQGNTASTIRPRTVRHAGVGPDCTSGGQPGKVFDVPLPAPPAGATAVTYGIVTNPTTGVQVEVTQIPSMTQGLIACVQQSNTWNLSSDVTVTVYYIFS